MGNINIIYRVVGRYMDGQKVIGYHLVGSDGSQLPVNRERAIFMISNGLIENMRIQSDTSSDKNGIIVRGKGVNLNKLPVYDEGKQSFRGDSASQKVANSDVKVKKNSGLNPMGQVKIVGRIMMGTKCIGYEIEDHSGARSKLGRDKVLNLGFQKLLSNAEVNKIKTDKGNQFALRGRGCNLMDLPIYILEDGKILDPSKKDTGISYRVIKAKRSGLVVNLKTEEKKSFQAGNYIVCGINGLILVEDVSTVASKYTVVKDMNTATCDDYIDKISDYSIEFFGQPPINLSKEMVLKWGIIKAK